MSKKAKKTVLIVDDKIPICETLKDHFDDYSEKAECPYEFIVDIATSYDECVKKVLNKDKNYDVVVLDIHMEEVDSGLKLNIGMWNNKNTRSAIRIILTGYPNNSECVEAMRRGAWDYIVKEDVGEKSTFQIVAESALARLRQLDLLQELNDQTASWISSDFRKLQEDYGGKLVALWHHPEPSVIASGRNGFELESNLKKWRREHASWEEPRIVLIPALNGH